MLATIHNETWNLLNMQHITQILKDETVQTSSVVAIKSIKEPSTWLKVATILEKNKQKPPTYQSLELFKKLHL